MKQPDRLKKRSQFLYAAREGCKIVTPGLIAQIVPRKEMCDVHVGFTVTKKVGNSVVRNRTRRRLREALHLVAREQFVRGGDIVLIGRAATRSRPFDKLQNDVRRVVSALDDLHK